MVYVPEPVKRGGGGRGQGSRRPAQGGPTRAVIVCKPIATDCGHRRSSGPGVWSQHPVPSRQPQRTHGGQCHENVAKGWRPRTRHRTALPRARGCGRGTRRSGRGRTLARARSSARSPGQGPRLPAPAARHAQPRRRSAPWGAGRAEGRRTRDEGRRARGEGRGATGEGRGVRAGSSPSGTALPRTVSRASWTPCRTPCTGTSIATTPYWTVPTRPAPRGEPGPAVSRGSVRPARCLRRTVRDGRDEGVHRAAAADDLDRLRPQPRDDLAEPPCDSVRPASSCSLSNIPSQGGSGM